MTPLMKLRLETAFCESSVIVMSPSLKPFLGTDVRSVLCRKVHTIRRTAPFFNGFRTFYDARSELSIGGGPFYGHESWLCLTATVEVLTMRHGRDGPRRPARPGLGDCTSSRMAGTHAR